MILVDLHYSVETVSLRDCISVNTFMCFFIFSTFSSSAAMFSILSLLTYSLEQTL